MDYDSDSNSNSVPQRVNSSPLRPIEWEYCPATTDFILKLKTDNKTSKLCYTLKEGKPLPYKPNITGI